jgi:hypothetical protein
MTIAERQDAMKQRQLYLRGYQRNKKKRSYRCRRYVERMMDRLSTRRVYEGETGELREFKEELSPAAKLLWPGYFASLYQTFEKKR